MSNRGEQQVDRNRRQAAAAAERAVQETEDTLVSSDLRAGRVPELMRAANRTAAELPGFRQAVADVLKDRGRWLDLDAETPREMFVSGEQLRAELAAARDRWVEAERIRREKRTKMESARVGRDRERAWQGGTPWYGDEHPAERSYAAAVDEFNEAVRAADKAKAERDELAKRIRHRVRVVVAVPPDLTEPRLPWDTEG